MQDTEQNRKFVLGMISQISDLYGGPQTEAQMNSICRAFLKIIGDQEERKNRVDGGPDWDIETLGPKYETIPGVSAEETAKDLPDAIRTNCSRWPSIPQVRTLYQRLGYLSADGIRIQERDIE